MAKRYRVLTGLNYPTDPKVLRRLEAGENLSPEERKEKRVEMGEIVSDIPSGSVDWLLEAGYIEEVGDGEAVRPRR